MDRSVKTGRFAHAFLFTGPPHTGKMTLARNLAQALNCGSDNRPCNECSSCRRVAAGKHPDVQVLQLNLEDRKKVITIEQVENMQSNASLPPYEGKYKVFIFEDADKLSHDAANRLLKTLEEPMPQVVIILVTSRESDLLPTVISRCQRIEMPPLPIAVVEEILADKYGAPPEDAALLSRLSRGRLGWAISALQDRSLLETRQSRIGDLLEMRSASITKRLSYASDLASRFGKSREEVDDIMELWLRWWNDLLLVSAGNADRIVNLDHESELAEQAQNLTIPQLTRALRDLQEAGRQLEQNVNPRLVLEVLMLSMP